MTNSAEPRVSKVACQPSYQDVFTLYAQLVHNFSRAYGFRLLEGSQAPGCQNVFYITVWIVHPCSPMRELTTLVSLYSLLLVYTQ